MFDKHGSDKLVYYANLKWQVLLLLSALLIPLSSTADMSDPTRPMFLRKAPVVVHKKKTVPRVSKPKAPPEKYILTSTLVSKLRTVAVINNHVVAVGDKVGSATVVAIEPAWVKLHKGGRDITLFLGTQGVRKAMRGHAVTKRQRLP